MDKYNGIWPGPISEGFREIGRAALAGTNVPQDPIVSLVEFKGCLWVATTKGVFKKREGEDVFDPVVILPLPEPVVVEEERRFGG